MTILINEGFEGAGYEESWAESVDAGCTLDEDSAIPGVPSMELGDQCLKSIVIDATNGDSFAYQTKPAQNKIYSRQHIYIGVNGLSDTQSVFIGGAFSAGFASIVFSTYIANVSGILNLGITYYSNGANQYPVKIPVDLNTWYEVEIYYDTTTNEWKWWLDRAYKDGGSLIAAIGIPTIFFNGCLSNTGSASSTVYTDVITIDNENRPKPAQTWISWQRKLHREATIYNGFEEQFNDACVRMFTDSGAPLGNFNEMFMWWAINIKGFTGAQFNDLMYKYTFPTVGSPLLLPDASYLLLPDSSNLNLPG